MKNLKKYEGFLDMFKKSKPIIKDIEITSKEDLINAIGEAYLKYNFSSLSTPFIKSILYDGEKFLLVYQGRVSRIKYTYDNLVQYAKESNATIIKTDYYNKNYGNN